MNPSSSYKKPVYPSSYTSGSLSTQKKFSDRNLNAQVKAPQNPNSYGGGKSMVYLGGSKNRAGKSTVGVAAAPTPVNTQSLRRENNGKDINVSLVPVANTTGVWGQSSNDQKPAESYTQENPKPAARPAPWASKAQDDPTETQTYLPPQKESKVKSWAEDSDDDDDDNPPQKIQNTNNIPAYAVVPTSTPPVVAVVAPSSIQDDNMRRPQDFRSSGGWNNNSNYNKDTYSSGGYRHEGSNFSSSSYSTGGSYGGVSSARFAGGSGGQYPSNQTPRQSYDQRQGGADGHGYGYGSGGYRDNRDSYQTGNTRNQGYTSHSNSYGGGGYRGGDARNAYGGGDRDRREGRHDEGIVPEWGTRPSLNVAPSVKKVVEPPDEEQLALEEARLERELLEKKKRQQEEEAKRKREEERLRIEREEKLRIEREEKARAAELAAAHEAQERANRVANSRSMQVQVQVESSTPKGSSSDRWERSRVPSPPRQPLISPATRTNAYGAQSPSGYYNPRSQPDMSNFSSNQSRLAAMKGPPTHIQGNPVRRPDNFNSNSARHNDGNEDSSQRDNMGPPPYHHQNNEENDANADAPQRRNTQQSRKLYDPKSDAFLDQKDVENSSSRPRQLKRNYEQGDVTQRDVRESKSAPINAVRAEKDEQRKLEAQKNSEARQKERAEREPRTQGVLYCFDENGDIVRVLTNAEKAAKVLREEQRRIEKEKNSQVSKTSVPSTVPPAAVTKTAININGIIEELSDEALAHKASQEGWDVIPPAVTFIEVKSRRTISLEKKDTSAPVANVTPSSRSQPPKDPLEIVSKIGMATQQQDKKSKSSVDSASTVEARVAPTPAIAPQPLKPAWSKSRDTLEMLGVASQPVKESTAPIVDGSAIETISKQKPKREEKKRSNKRDENSAVGAAGEKHDRTRPSFNMNAAKMHLGTTSTVGPTSKSVNAYDQNSTGYPSYAPITALEVSAGSNYDQNVSNMKHFDGNNISSVESSSEKEHLDRLIGSMTWFTEDSNNGGSLDVDFINLRNSVDNMIRDSDSAMIGMPVNNNEILNSESANVIATVHDREGGGYKGGRKSDRPGRGGARSSTKPPRDRGSGRGERFANNRNSSEVENTSNGESDMVVAVAGEDHHLEERGEFGRGGRGKERGRGRNTSGTSSRRREYVEGKSSIEANDATAAGGDTRERPMRSSSSKFSKKETNNNEQSVGPSGNDTLANDTGATSSADNLEAGRGAGGGRGSGRGREGGGARGRSGRFSGRGRGGPSDRGGSGGRFSRGPPRTPLSNEPLNSS